MPVAGGVMAVMAGRAGRAGRAATGKTASSGVPAETVVPEVTLERAAGEVMLVMEEASWLRFKTTLPGDYIHSMSQPARPEVVVRPVR